MSRVIRKTMWSIKGTYKVTWTSFCSAVPSPLMWMRDHQQKKKKKMEGDSELTLSLDGLLHVNNKKFMVASRLYIIISMISASFMAPQLVGNIFLVRISKPVRICFAKANRMLQVRSIIMKNSITQSAICDSIKKKKRLWCHIWLRRHNGTASPYMCDTILTIIQVTILQWGIPSSFTSPHCPSKTSCALLSPKEDLTTY